MTAAKKKKKRELTATSGGAKAAWAVTWENIKIIVTGRIFFGIFGLLATSICIHQVGIESFGAAVLTLSYVRLVGGVLRPATSGAVISYGAGPLSQKNREQLRHLTGLSLRLDFFAYMLAIIVSFLAFHTAQNAFNWTDITAQWMPYYILCTPFIMVAAPIGILRLLNRTKAVAARQAITALVRFLGALLVWAFDLGLHGVMAVWLAGPSIAGMAMYVLAWKYCKIYQIKPKVFCSAGEVRQEFKGFYSFNLKSMSSTAVTTAILEATPQLISMFLGAHAVGLFSIAKQVSQALTKLVTILGPVIMPEFSRLVAEKRWRAIRGLMLRTVAMSALAVILIVALVGLGGKPLLSFAFGPESLEGYDILLLVLASRSIDVLGFSFAPIIIAFKKAGAELIIALIGAAVFLVFFTQMTPLYGLTGVGIALIMQSAVRFLCRVVMVFVLARD